MASSQSVEGVGIDGSIKVAVVAGLDTADQKAQENGMAQYQSLLTEMIKQSAAEEKADLVLFPEYAMGVPLVAEIAAEVGTCPGADMPMQMAVSEAAKDNSIAVVAQICTREGGPTEKMYLSLIVFNQQGAVVAKYHKIHLCPGAEPTSVYLEGVQDFERNAPICTLNLAGMDIRIGLMICWEMLSFRPPSFRNEERVEELARLGAQLVLWSAGPQATTLASTIPVYKELRGLNKENKLPSSGWFTMCAKGAAKQVQIPVVCSPALGAGIAYSHDGKRLDAIYDEAAIVGTTGYTGRARVQIFHVPIPPEGIARSGYQLGNVTKKVFQSLGALFRDAQPQTRS